MDINGTYILNPAYYLRNDVKRCLIGAYDEARFPDLEFDSNITCHIHPANAQMLSFFDGKRTLAECITDIAGYFDLEQEQIKDIPNCYEAQFVHEDLFCWVFCNIEEEEFQKIVERISY